MDQMTELDGGDFSLSAEEVLKQIFTTCDVSNEGQLNVSKLINYMKPFLESNLIELKLLQTRLDPDDIDQLVDCELFCEIGKVWIMQLKDQSIRSNLCKLDMVAHSSPNSSFCLENLEETDCAVLPNLVHDIGKNEVKDKMSHIISQNKMLSNELSELKSTLEVLEEEKNGILKENKKINARLNLYNNLEEENKKLLQKIEELNDLHSASCKQYDVLKKSLKCSEQNNIQLNRKLNDANIKIQHLEEKLQNINSKEMMLTEHAKSLQEEIKHRDLKYTSLEISYADINARYEEQADNIKYYIEDNKRIQNEKTHLENILKQQFYDEQNFTSTKCSKNTPTENAENHKHNTNKQRTQYVPKVEFSKFNFLNYDSPNNLKPLDYFFNTPKLLRQIASPVTPNFGDNSFVSSSPLNTTKSKNVNLQNEIRHLSPVREDIIIPGQSVVEKSSIKPINKEEKPEKLVALEYSSEEDFHWQQLIHNSKIYTPHMSLHDEITQVTNFFSGESCKKDQSTQVDEEILPKFENNKIAIEQYKLDIHQLETENETHCKCINELKLELKNLKSKLLDKIDIETQTDSLTVNAPNALETCINEFENLRENIDSCESENKNLQETINKLTTEMHELQLQFHGDIKLDAYEMGTKLESKLDINYKNMLAENEHLKNELSLNNVENYSLNEAIKQLHEKYNSSCGELLKQIDSQKLKLDDLQEQNKSLLEDNTRIKNEKREIASAYRSLQMQVNEEVKNLQDLNNVYVKERNEYKGKFYSVEANFKHLEVNFKSQENEIKMLQEYAQHLQLELNEKQVTVEKLHIALENQDNEIDSRLGKIIQRNKELVDANNALKSTIDDLYKTRQTEIQKLDELVSENKKMCNEIQIYKNELEMLNFKIQNLTDTNLYWQQKAKQSNENSPVNDSCEMLGEKHINIMIDGQRCKISSFNRMQAKIERMQQTNEKQSCEIMKLNVDLTKALEEKVHLFNHNIELENELENIKTQMKTEHDKQKFANKKSTLKIVERANLRLEENNAKLSEQMTRINLKLHKQRLLLEEFTLLVRNLWKVNLEEGKIDSFSSKEFPINDEEFQKLESQINITLQLLVALAEMKKISTKEATVQVSFDIESLCLSGTPKILLLDPHYSSLKKTVSPDSPSTDLTVLHKSNMRNKIIKTKRPDSPDSVSFSSLHDNSSSIESCTDAVSFSEITGIEHITDSESKSVTDSNEKTIQKEQLSNSKDVLFNVEQQETKIDAKMKTLFSSLQIFNSKALKIKTKHQLLQLTQMENNLCQEITKLKNMLADIQGENPQIAKLIFEMLLSQLDLIKKMYFRASSCAIHYGILQRDARFMKNVDVIIDCVVIFMDLLKHDTRKNLFAKSERSFKKMKSNFELLESLSDNEAYLNNHPFGSNDDAITSKKKSSAKWTVTNTSFNCFTFFLVIIIFYVIVPYFFNYVKPSTACSLKNSYERSTRRHFY